MTIIKSLVIVSLAFNLFSNTQATPGKQLNKSFPLFVKAAKGFRTRKNNLHTFEKALELNLSEDKARRIHSNNSDSLNDNETNAIKQPKSQASIPKQDNGILSRCLHRILLPGTFKRSMSIIPVINGLSSFDFYDNSNQRLSIEFGSYKPTSEFPKKETAMAFFGGNKMDSMIYFPLLQSLSDETETTIFIMNYPGFGNSEGKPSLENAINSADTFINKLKKEGYKDIIPIGYSFGGSICANIAKKHQAKAICLVSTFTSARNVIKDKVPAFISPIIDRKFNSDTLNNEQILATIKHPMSAHIIHGTRDWIVLFKNADNLFNSAKENPVVDVDLRSIVNGNHFTPIFNKERTKKAYQPFIQTVRKINGQESTI